MANMCLDQTCIAIVAEPPDVRNNLAGRTDMIRIDRQQMQELTLYRVRQAFLPSTRTSLCSESTRMGPTVMMEEGLCARVERPLLLRAWMCAKSCVGKKGLRK